MELNGAAKMDSCAPKHFSVAVEQGKHALTERGHTLIERSYAPKHCGVAAELGKHALTKRSHTLIQRSYAGTSRSYEAA